MYVSTREHIAKLQRYEQRKARFLHYFDKTLNLVTIATVGIVIYAVLVGVTA